MTDTRTHFKCGCPRSPENIYLCHGRWAICRKCKNERTKVAARKCRAKARAERAKLPPPPKSDQQVRSERRIAGIRRAVSAKARERIALGLDPNTATQAAVRHAQYAIAAENELRDRLATPIEQAKAMLQRRYRPVVSEAIYGGDPELFRVGYRTVTRDELLAMAGAA